MSLFRIFRPLRPDLAELRAMVDQLPLAVRIAMLDGVRRERIIAGAYTDDRDGVCPMLAAHRHGGRYSHPDFARTWDEFAEAPFEGHRTARREHVEALDATLRASIEAELRVDDREDPVRETGRVAPRPGPPDAGRDRGTTPAAEPDEVARAINA